MEIIPEDIKVKSKSIAIVGWEDGGPGQVHSWIEKECNYEISCFINPSDQMLRIDIDLEKRKKEARIFAFPQNDTFKGRPLITSTRWADILCDLGINKVLVMTPDNRERLKNIQVAHKKELKLISAIHPTATILDDAILHENVIIYAKAVVGYRAEIHYGAVLNTGAQIDHHNVVYRCASIDPGVVTAGNVTIGECATVHTGATIINKIRIGADAIIGAGSVIIRDVPSGVTVVGVPGQIKEKQKQKLNI